MTSTIQFRVDENLRARAQEVAESMGFDLPSLLRGFLTQMVQENRLPYHPTADPFLSEANCRHLEKVYEDVKHGRNCSSHELLEE